MKRALYYVAWVVLGMTLPLPGKTIGLSTALIFGLAAFTIGALRADTEGGERG